MLRNFKFLLIALFFAFASCGFTSKSFDNPDKDKLLIQIITYVLEQGHFSPKELNDSFSSQVYEHYLQQLDPFKRYFLQSDINDFEVYKTEIDDQLRVYDIAFFNLTHERLLKRVEESKAFYNDILSKPFDYSIDEKINTDYENSEFVKSKKQLRNRWRKQLKYATLSNYDNELLGEKAKQEEDASYKIKKHKELEEKARKATLNSFNLSYEGLDDLERKDWFSVYVNAIVEEFDPHTFYFAPEDKDRFDQLMSGKFEGIGARLQKRMGEIKVIEVISGGPAWQQKGLEAGDIILKVRQEDELDAIDIVGMRLEDAIKLIKGTKGTKVNLTLKRVDGTIKEITITRDIVELEETYAKSSVVKKDDRTFGVIDLPKFYVDFDDYKTERNAASDIKLEIERLKEEGIEGLVIDLRGNGGGSLQTVVDMAGLFIKDGPIVQVRYSGKQKEVLRDKDKSITWDGPLVILVNELSASASEILAAAMQDYKRAIIIGSKQTYGKGTVQNMYNLNTVIRNSDHGDLGALKLTTQKFYRINGGSTQLEGVKSDVIVPDRYSYIDLGEKDQENPLPWDSVDAVDYTFWENYFDYNKTIENSINRMKNNTQLKLIDENARWIKTRMDETTQPLNYTQFKSKMNLIEAESKKFDSLSEYKTDLTFNSPAYEINLFEKDTVLKDKRERWHKSLSQDVYMEEAVNVLQDLKTAYSINKVATVKD